MLIRPFPVAAWRCAGRTISTGSRAASHFNPPVNAVIRATVGGVIVDGFVLIALVTALVAAVAATAACFISGISLPRARS